MWNYVNAHPDAWQVAAVSWQGKASVSPLSLGFETIREVSKFCNEYWRGTEAKFVLELYPLGFLGLGDAISQSQRVWYSSIIRETIVFGAWAGVMGMALLCTGTSWYSTTGCFERFIPTLYLCHVDWQTFYSWNRRHHLHSSATKVPNDIWSARARWCIAA